MYAYYVNVVTTIYRYLPIEDGSRLVSYLAHFVNSGIGSRDAAPITPPMPKGKDVAAVMSLTSLIRHDGTHQAAKSGIFLRYQLGTVAIQWRR